MENKYTNEQITELLKNKNVIKINKNSIVYNPNFKIWAVNESLNTYKSANEIFKEGGFDIKIFSKNTPTKRLAIWKKQFAIDGIEAFTTRKRRQIKNT